jgi:voltage-gated potassium channel
MDHRGNLRRLQVAGLLLLVVVVAGTGGYMVLGFSLLDALYQTVTTVATVGFREVEEFGTAEKVFTVVLITVGVGTVIYSFTMVVEMAVEGHLGALVGRTRMDRRIASLHDHVVVCGLGRVGRAITRDMLDAGRTVVVVDNDESRIASIVETTPEVLYVVGDATHDATLRAAGIERASALVAALADDAENLFVTLSGRAIRNELFIVTRAREEESVPKLQRAGADQVVNPQELGARQMASLILTAPPR